MEASDWIALAALLVAIAVAIRGEVKLRAERGDREREDKRRDKELGLFQRQVEEQSEHRLDERRAVLICSQGSRGGIAPDRDEYDVALHNGGRAPAHDVRSWATDKDGRALSDTQRLGSLAPGDPPKWFKLTLAHADSRNPNLRLFLHASWTDGAGEHEESLDELGHV